MERGPRPPQPEQEPLTEGRIEDRADYSPLTEDEVRMVSDTIVAFVETFRHLEGPELSRQSQQLERRLLELLAEGRAEKERIAAEEKLEIAGLKESLGSQLKKRFAAIGAIVGLGLGTAVSVGAFDHVHDAQPKEPAAAASEKKPAQPTPPEKAEAGHEAETVETSVSLEEIDSAATPERMRRLLKETLPKGWSGQDIETISFVDVEGYIVPNVTPEQRAIATAQESMLPKGRTTIRFFKGSKKASRQTVFGDILVHEVAHANDWERDGDMPQQDRTALRDGVLARIDATDRYKSDYVESIAKKETNQRAAEYWAEICEAYLNAEDPLHSMPLADVELIRREIARTDPKFDRNEAFRKRREIMREMRWEGTRVAIEEQMDAMGVTVDDSSETVEWIGARMQRELKKVDEGQQPARVELFEKVKAWALDPARKDFTEKLGIALWKRETLLELARNSDNVEDRDRAISALGSALKDLQESRQRQPEVPGQFEFETGVMRLAEERDLVAGASERGGMLDEKETMALRDPAAKQRGWDKNWFIESMGWITPYEPDTR